MVTPKYLAEGNFLIHSHEDGSQSERGFYVGSHD